MKKILRYFVVFACALICLMGSTTSIWAASASLTGPSTVRGGDTITLELKVSDKGKYGLEGVLEYDSSQVTLSSATTALKGWKIEQEGAMIIAYDDTLANSLKGNDTVVTLKFKVASNIAQGTKLTISIKDIVATDGTNESSIGKASYSVTIAKPLSTNANLSSLKLLKFVFVVAISSKVSKPSVILPNAAY